MHSAKRQDIQQAQERIPILKSLRARVLIILLAALLPVVLLNLFTTYSRFIEAKHRARSDLQDLSEIITDEIDHYLSNAFALLTILSKQPEVLSRTPSCGRFLAATLKGFYGYSNLFVIDRAGHVACSAVASTREVSFAGQSWWKRLNARGGPVVGEPGIEPITGEQAVIIALPLTADVSGQRAAIALALKDTTLQYLRRLARVPPATLLFVLNDTGNLLLGPSDKASLAQLPANPNFLGKASKLGEVFDGKAKSGGDLVYAVVPMLEDKVFGLIAQGAMTLDGPRLWALTEQVLLPILLTAGVLVIVWFGTDRILLRWIRHLTAVAIAYRRGHMSVRARNLQDAPTELQQLGETLGDMAGAIETRENRLKDTIAQCELLIREVHHRVKNNLQVIASLLSLQARNEEAPDARRALRTIQLRIEAIALVHRNIYLADEVEYVNLQDLVPNVAHQVEQFYHDAGRIELAIEAEPIWLTVDRAIPLSQFIVEALANSYSHAFPHGRGGHISITLHCNSSGEACLLVADNGVGLPSPGTETHSGRLGHALMQSLARQLGGTAEFKSADGMQAVLRFAYRAPDIAPANARKSGAQTASSMSPEAAERAMAEAHS
ncbi:MAG: histidine kinase dimerization/phosphoacceptor domain -containing protein [Alphaproteobacteria bacterium]